ncbi:MAG: TonB-dependent receptor [candidate division KSB1 bacterium]|nr:TonB-dependent receptor [candidate division KSB1 bacterium]
MKTAKVIYKLALALTLLGPVITKASPAPEMPAPPAAAKGAVIKGVIMDSLLAVPIEYANVVLMTANGGQQVDGTVSRKDGTFLLNNVKPGNYELHVKFIGYYEKVLPNIRVASNSPEIDLGKIELMQAVIMLQGVETTAEKAPIEYQIDKKVINVSKQYTAASGTAIDVLENVPSVTVDLEGNVALRGSSNFRLLIDGRPTIMEAADALRQIPASSIENIEIITNPSAKFDPDGTAGIINLVLKKNALQGINGMISLNGGINDRYGSDILLNRRTGGVNVYLGVNYMRRYNPGTMIQRNQTFAADTISFITADGSGNRNFGGYGLRGGLDWDITKQDLFTLGIRLGNRGMKNNQTSNYASWTTPGVDVFRYTSSGLEKRGGMSGQVNLSFKHKFDNQGHELTFETNYENETSDEESKDELLNAIGELESGRRATEKGPQNDLRLKADYVRPLRGAARLEAGLQSRIARSEERNDLYEYTPTLQQYVYAPQFSYAMDFTHDIHAAYLMYANKLGKLGYQAGLRGEYTYRILASKDQAERYTINRLDYFPTLHFSYELPAGQQVMASYTRRIERPRDFFLEPFLVWIDAYNVRRGNPSLLPEYINSYELSYQKSLGRNLFSAEVYYRTTENRIDRIQSVYAENVMLTTMANIGTDEMLGGELMLNFDMKRLWNVNLMANLFDYTIKGVMRGENFERNSFNWNVRMNNTLRLSQSTRMQVNLMYNSPSVSAQGRREGFFIASAAVRRGFLNDKLEVILQVNDLLRTGKFEFYAQGPDFYRYNRFKREAPMVSLTLNYILNNYKQQRQQRNGSEEENGYSGFDMMQ